MYIDFFKFLWFMSLSLIFFLSTHCFHMVILLAVWSHGSSRATTNGLASVHSKNEQKKSPTTSPSSFSAVWKSNESLQVSSEYRLHWTHHVLRCWTFGQ